MASTPAEAPAQSPYDRIGGIDVLRQITDRFYDLMDTDPAYQALRAMHAPDLAPMRDSLPGFLSGWAGGPRQWFEANPGKCMMSMHKPFPITRVTAGQWADCMTRAIADVDPADTEIADAMAQVLGQMARNMASG
ncbi:group II truncated hemoglobin [Novosphingobium sp. SL115]|uniref:group II truncated hemoglobin n=1 Tax=Novosphingobium sp. SL115 TaxID=2995150 RepID=UPI00227357FC|nr:group II truncated hemoglobin [Novosphingobium sp. SL115]MCY1670382.1 group II truncated hemoglobin [Novosphingobium sp. SL115]